MSQTLPEPKLSDYMLAGIKLTRPLRYEFMEWDDGPYYACPIGAACFARDADEARELLDMDYASEYARKAFPELNDTISWTPPFKQERPEPVDVQLMNVITTLNDFLGWRRDRTARYIKSLGY